VIFIVFPFFSRVAHSGTRVLSVMVLHILVRAAVMPVRGQLDFARLLRRNDKTVKMRQICATVSSREARRRHNDYGAGHSNSVSNSTERKVSGESGCAANSFFQSSLAFSKAVRTP
jgi:hypothetical protein